MAGITKVMKNNGEAKTVKELIEILLTLNPETRLFTREGEEGYTDGVYVEKTLMHLNKYHNNVDGSHDSFQGSITPVEVCDGIIIG